MRRIIVAIVLACLFVALLGRYFHKTDAYLPEHFHQKVFRAELETRMREEGLSPSDIQGATEGQLWLLSNFGAEAFLAGKRYPEQAVTLYLLFSHTKEFAECLRQHGYHKVIPVVWYFFTHEKAHSYELQNLIMRGIEGFRSKGMQGAWEKMQEARRTTLMPDERAWIAINRILHTNGRYLSQFVLDDADVAQRSQVSRIFGSLEEVLLGDVEALEWKYRSGQEITAGNLLWAAVDVSFLAAIGAKSLHLLSKTGRLGVKVGRTAKLSRTAMFMSRLPARVAKYGTIGLGAYLLYKHPAAFNAGISAAAEFLGLPYPSVWPYFVWFLLFFALFYPVLLFIIPIITVVVHALLLFRRMLVLALVPKTA